MFDLNDILKGYNPDQYAETMLYIMANFLKEKGLIDMQEFQEYHKNNLNELLNKIVERDKEEARKKLEEIEEKIGE